RAGSSYRAEQEPVLRADVGVGARATRKGEAMMRSFVKGALAAALLAGTAGIATAQTAVIDLTPDQRTTVFRSMTRERIVVAPPAGFPARGRGEVASSGELLPAPDTVEGPAVRRD